LDELIGTDFHESISEDECVMVVSFLRLHRRAWAHARASCGHRLLLDGTDGSNGREKHKVAQKVLAAV
jgi:hypothetical protein